MKEPCVPSRENDHPVMPKNAIFKDLLLSENHTRSAIEAYLTKQVIIIAKVLRMQANVWFNLIGQVSNTSISSI